MGPRIESALCIVRPEKGSSRTGEDRSAEEKWGLASAGGRWSRRALALHLDSIAGRRAGNASPKTGVDKS